ncbi:hypothetical protein ACU4GD_26360 [Cupriavidus basilensis]
MTTPLREIRWASLQDVVQAALVPVATLSATDRGAGGFGSTGR